MAHSAMVLYVMVASPSDVSEARDAVYTAISRWNESNTAIRNVVLVPLRWETGSVPVLGAHPQHIINAQLVDKSDILVALFGSRIGSQSPDAISGTVAEIERVRDAGKPVHVYVSKAPHPNGIEAEQLKALEDFKEALKSKGLLGSFASPAELTAHIWQAIEFDLAKLNLTPVTTGPSGVEFRAQPGSENWQQPDSRGRLTNKTRRWVDLNNRGSDDALNVHIESLTPGAWIFAPEPTVIHAGQVRRFPMSFALQCGDPVIRVTWSDKNGEAQSKEFHVG